MRIRGRTARNDEPTIRSVRHNHEIVGIVTPALQEKRFLTTDTNLLHSWLDGRVQVEFGYNNLGDEVQQLQ